MAIDPLKINLANYLGAQAIPKKLEEDKRADQRIDNTKATAQNNNTQVTPPARVANPIVAAIGETLKVGGRLAALVLGEQLYKEGKKAIEQMVQSLTPGQRQTIGSASNASPLAVQVGLYAYTGGILGLKALKDYLGRPGFDTEAVETAALVLGDIDITSIIGSQQT